MAENVDEVMASIPPQWRHRWCGGENGVCACVGCVQTANRLIMTGLKVHEIDPERIDERKIPPETYTKYKVTKDEWEAWKARQAT